MAPVGEVFVRLPMQLKDAKLCLLGDMESGLRALGKDALNHGLPVEEWVWADLHAVILEQRELQ